MPESVVVMEEWSGLARQGRHSVAVLSSRDLLDAGGGSAGWYGDRNLDCKCNQLEEE